jgi:hypothetical protein
MKTIWSDRLVPILKTRQAGQVIEFALGVACAASLLAFAGLVLYLHRKVGDL